MNTTHGEFADDLFNIVFDKEKIIPVIVNNSKSLSKIGLKLEPSKTELFHVNKKGEEEVYGLADTDLTFSDDSTFDEMFKIQARQSIRYLGDQLGTPRAAIKDRISKASQANGRFYHKLWSKPNISYQVKIKVFKACILPVLQYGLKCHASTETMMKPLNYFCLRKLKSIFGLPFDAKISYEKMDEILESHKIGWEWPMRTLQRQRLQFFTRKLEDGEFVNLITPKQEDKRKTGRPRFRMIDAIIHDLWEMKEIDYEVYITNDIRANDRGKRAKKVMNACILSIEESFIDPG